MMTRRIQAILIFGLTAFLSLSVGSFAAGEGQTVTARTSMTPATGEIDPVLLALRQRRLALDAREEALELQALELKAVKQQIELRIDVLRTLAETVKTLLVEQDAAETVRFKRLARTYEAMRPEEAAKLFDQLDTATRIAIARQMRQAKLGPVLARMVLENATRLTNAMSEIRANPDQGS